MCVRKAFPKKKKTTFIRLSFPTSRLFYQKFEIIFKLFNGPSKHPVLRADISNVLNFHHSYATINS